MIVKEAGSIEGVDTEVAVTTAVDVISLGQSFAVADLTVAEAERQAMYGAYFKVVHEAVCVECSHPVDLSEGHSTSECWEARQDR